MRNYGKILKCPSMSTSLEAPDPKDGSTPNTVSGCTQSGHQPLIIGCLHIQPLSSGPETLVLLE